MATKLDYWRQNDIISQDDLNKYPVTLIGAGGIGSPTAIALAKMGVHNLTIVDYDKIELHNIATQFYRKSDIGAEKTEALADSIEAFADTDVRTFCDKLSYKPEGLVISGVDSMASREEIWKHIKMNTKVPLYIDGRMGAEVIRIFSVRPAHAADIRQYEATLYTDEEALDEPCTAKATIYTGMSVAGLIARHVKEFSIGRSVPFEVTFDLVSLTLMTTD